MGPEEAMNQATPHDSVGQGRRRPYWIVGLALFGLVVVLLAGAFLLDRQFRPAVGVESPPAVAATGEPTDAPVAIVPPTTEATPPTGQPTLPPTASAASAVPTTAGTPGGLRVATSPLELEIEAAYLRYWEIRSEALFNLDPTRLPEVMAGAELERTRAEIVGLRDQGRAAKIVVEHRIAFLRVSDSRAELYDEYFNKSYLVDTQTKQPVQPPGSGGIAKISYQLEKGDGVWRVVDGMRHD